MEQREHGGCSNEGNGLREASRLYNVLVETLRRRVNGSVAVSTKSNYIVDMAVMGLTREEIKSIAFRIVDTPGRKHGMAGFDGFRSRHPRLSIKKPCPIVVLCGVINTSLRILLLN